MLKLCHVVKNILDFLSAKTALLVIDVTKFHKMWYNSQVCVLNLYTADFLVIFISLTGRDRRGRDRMVVGFTTIYAISAYHH